MLPLINGKSLMDCNEEDFQVLLNNPDYRENQYLEYKGDFGFRRVTTDHDKESEVYEFRNDICSFANSEGGYLIFGIKESEGIATKLNGVEIKNLDNFELELRNKLNPIAPQIPAIQFHFVKLENGRYLVVTHIDHDFFAPYVHITDNTNYKIYKRDGNGKSVVRYTELKNMFMQSRVLEDEIFRFRKNRIGYLKREEILDYQPFMIFHIIPESFLSDRKQIFIIEQRNHDNYGAVFANTKIDTHSMPCVDGVRYLSNYSDEVGLLYNNGIAEYVLPIKDFFIPIGQDLYFEREDAWYYIDYVAQGYRKIIPQIFGKQRYFGCVSIVGSKGIVTEKGDLTGMHSRIDRDEVICTPVPFVDIEDLDTFNKDCKRLHLEFLLAIGLRKNDMVRKLIKKVASD